MSECLYKKTLLHKLLIVQVRIEVMTAFKSGLPISVLYTESGE